MNKPLVSIVTPSFNQGHFIEETLLSVKNQTYPYIEHMVIDAGSSDETLTILKRYEGIYNLRWISEPDKGMYDAINKGMQIAKGEILAYLNTDDSYFPWTVQTAVSYLIKNPGFGLVFGDHLNHYQNGKMGLVIQPPYRLKLLRRTGWSLPQPTVFWRRKVFEALGDFDAKLKIIGDWDFWMRAASKFKIGQIREFQAIMQIHPDQKTAAKKGELFCELEERLKRYNPPEELNPYQKFFELKVYAWTWQRLYMAKFLFSYLLQKLRFPNRSWSKFIGLNGFVLASWWNILIGFFPFGHRGGDKWLIERKGQTYPSRNRKHRIEERAMT